MSRRGEPRRIAYVVLTSDQVGSFSVSDGPEGPLYTKDFLKGTLQLLGCKLRYAEKLSDDAFAKIEALLFGNGRRRNRLLWRMHPRGDGSFWVSIPRKDFNRLILHCLESIYVRSATVADDWHIATSLRERRRSVTILLCGTSGTGKSTLASLLATRLRITTVVSTDGVRNVMRSMTRSASENPLIFASSYDAGQALQRQHSSLGDVSALPPSKWAVKGFKAQSECVLEQLETLITSAEARNESLVCEGVHLSLNFVIRLMRSHPSIIPFLVYIGDEQQHAERFSVRAKYMARDCSKNRYTYHLANIRCIQEFLVRKSDLHLIPRVNNTNVDRSVAAIHQTTFGCLRRVMKGESLYDPITNTAKLVHAEYRQVKSMAEWKAKGALEAIRSKSQETPPLCVASGSSIASEDREGMTDVLPEAHRGLQRVASSDTNDEMVGSDEDSDDGRALEPAQTEYGSLMETTDWDEHDE